MIKHKFEIDEKVFINPCATREDFKENSCCTSFMKLLYEPLKIEKRGISKGQPTYYIDGWWILEKCLMRIKEDNEI
ncbi:hypothetical protein [Romboutsia sp.]|uniref:hypothetical protein n=1 Tax=Romboutsia sp. TaxID=1965302 RepID=UPI002CA20BEE|nr:hypothetical protein [Romboutsia sp.]HSQ90192.1 hypothetical protein [Romboutsia sp.]